MSQPSMSQWNVGDDDKKDNDSDVGVFFCFFVFFVFIKV
jgi:hypothetical protein